MKEFVIMKKLLLIVIMFGFGLKFGMIGLIRLVIMLGSIDNIVVEVIGKEESCIMDIFVGVIDD